MAERKYCEDCRFFRPSDNAVFMPRCKSPKAPTSTDGKQFLTRADAERAAAEGAFADIMREFSHRCGPDAKWFEAKTEQVAA